MSLSAEYCNHKTGDRGGGGGAALVHQRKLIQGLFVWTTLLTLVLGAYITFQFIHRESQNEKTVNESPSNKFPVMEFLPNWTDSEMVESLQWITLRSLFINNTNEQLLVNEFGHYFLYLQVTLDSNEKANHTITVKSKTKGDILKGLINGSKTSTVFIAKGIPLDRGDTLTVTCQPKAKIQKHHTVTHMGVIKLSLT